jgi:hypothetical protein
LVAGKRQQWEQPVSFVPAESAADGAPANISELASADENTAEPPSRLPTPVFLLGQDSYGRWVAQNTMGTCGGLFVDRTQALRFIRFEGGGRAFVTVRGILELKLPRPSQMPSDFNTDAASLAA